MVPTIPANPPHLSFGASGTSRFPLPRSLRSPILLLARKEDDWSHDGPAGPESGQIDLTEVFQRVQQEMLAQIAVGRLFEHASAAGTATEHHWLDLFSSAISLSATASALRLHHRLADGSRSRQIDIAIFDNLYSPLLFPHPSGFHIPAESVYAVFEVKPTFSRQWLQDAAEKAASVRGLHRTSVPVIAGGTKRSAIRPKPILAGLLATGSVWNPETFAANLTRALASLDNPLDLGCSLDHGAFEYNRSLRISDKDESLIFFVIRLLERLRAMGTAPAADLMLYARALRSFRK